MVDDNVTGRLIIDESVVDFTGPGPLGVAVAHGGDDVKRQGVSLCILSCCTTQISGARGPLSYCPTNDQFLIPISTCVKYLLGAHPTCKVTCWSHASPRLYPPSQ